MLPRFNQCWHPPLPILAAPPLFGWGRPSSLGSADVQEPRTMPTPSLLSRSSSSCLKNYNPSRPLVSDLPPSSANATRCNQKTTSAFISVSPGAGEFCFSFFAGGRGLDKKKDLLSASAFKQKLACNRTKIACSLHRKTLIIKTLVFEALMCTNPFKVR